jgi:hypothetical protein
MCVFFHHESWRSFSRITILVRQLQQVCVEVDGFRFGLYSLHVSVVVHGTLVHGPNVRSALRFRQNFRRKSSLDVGCSSRGVATRKRFTISL